MSSGTTFREISGKRAAQIPFPLPPLPEQKRIVQKLSSMLGKLKAARELIREAKETFEERRAAILNKAFTGELTKKWREEKLSVNKWKRVIINDVICDFQNGLSKRKGKKGIDVIVIRLADIDNFKIVHNNIRRIKLTDKEIVKYSLDKDDILIIRVNGSPQLVGKFILCNEVQGWAFCDHLIRMKVDKNLILPQFLSYSSQTRTVRDYIDQNKVSSAGQNTISQKTLSNISIKLPPLLEQKEIVRILDKLLDHEDKARALIDMEEHIDLLEKSILSRAFRGELGTNDPNDEPAIELLKRSLKEKSKAA